MKRVSAYMQKTPEERREISRKNNARNKQRSFEKEMGIFGFDEFGDSKHTQPMTTTEIQTLRSEVSHLRDELNSLKEFMRVSAVTFLEGTEQEKNNGVSNNQGGD